MSKPTYDELVDTLLDVVWQAVGGGGELFWETGQRATAWNAAAN